MSELTEATNAVWRRMTDMVHVLRSVEQHLLTEQAEALGTRHERPESRERPPGDAESDQTGTTGYSDPTGNSIAQIGHYENMRRKLREGISSIDRDIEHMHRLCQQFISTKPDPTLFDEPTCPGWNLDMQTSEVGGTCGRRLEERRRPDGTVSGLRTHCPGCRTALGRVRRRGRDAGMCEGHIDEYVNDHTANGDAPEINYEVIHNCPACQAAQAVDSVA